MRVLLLILVLLNLLALASIQGWLGTSAPQGEPERLSNQLNPERIVIRPTNALPPPAEDPPPQLLPAPTPPAAESPPAKPAGALQDSSPPTTTTDACITYGGLTEAQAESLTRIILANNPKLRAERKMHTTPSAWWVHIPPAGGREGAERRAAELRTLGIADLFIVQEPGPSQFAVSLGLFKTEAKAQQHLANLQNKRVRTAVVTSRNAVVHRIEVQGTRASLDAFSQSRPVRSAGATISECKP